MLVAWWSRPNWRRTSMGRATLLGNEQQRTWYLAPFCGSVADPYGPCAIVNLKQQDSSNKTQVTKIQVSKDSRN